MTIIGSHQAFPRATQAYMGYCAIGHAVNPGKRRDGLPGGTSVTNLADLVGREPRPAIALAECLATLGITVTAIVGHGSKKEMVWAYAPGYVTPVQHAYTIWDCSKMESPGNPVGEAHTAIIISDAAILAVAKGHRSPEPARFRSFYLRPKSQSNGDSHRGVS